MCTRDRDAGEEKGCDQGMTVAVNTEIKRQKKMVGGVNSDLACHLSSTCFLSPPLSFSVFLCVCICLCVLLIHLYVCSCVHM